jgi:hypothetical protein
LWPAATQKLEEAQATLLMKPFKPGSAKCDGDEVTPHDFPRQMFVQSSKTAMQKDGEVHARTPLPSVPLVVPRWLAQLEPSHLADPEGVGDAIQKVGLVQTTALTARYMSGPVKK